MSQNSVATSVVPASVRRYSLFLMFIAGLGGLLYGIDVGIMAGALPFLQESLPHLNPAQVSEIVGAVLGGSIVSSLIAGALADWLGRKKMLVISALIFMISIPLISFSSSYHMLMFGRIVQGFSAGLVGVIVPLYLAECLGAASRGKGTGMFQFFLTIGLVVAAVIALFFTWNVESVQTTGVEEAIKAAKDSAWRNIFMVAIIPGLVLFIGAFFISESPRWLFRKGRREEALKALLRGNSEAEAYKTYAELEENAKEDDSKTNVSKKKAPGESLFQRKYYVPFILTIVILACTQATGVNSVLNYCVSIFRQGGLEDSLANGGDIALKVANCVMTLVAVTLVDKKGRKFLLKLGTGGIIIGLCCVATLFLTIEHSRTNVTEKVQALVANKTLDMDLKNPAILSDLGVSDADLANKQLIVSYIQGANNMSTVADFTPQPQTRAEDGKVLTYSVPEFDIKKADPDKDGNIADIRILRAEVGDRPTHTTGWMIVGAFIIFMASFAIGPGVCVWLALSELMPNRIRSIGMSLGMVINQGVSTCIAMTFLPVVGAIGFSSVFYILAGFTVIYFITVTFFLPETKGKTLEEIEDYFAKGGK